MRPVFLRFILAVGASFSASRALMADPIATTRPSDVALEIEALRALNDLQATRSQVNQLRDASADKPAKTQATDIQDIDQAAAGERACYITLLRLREDLLKCDPTKIEQGEKDMAALEERLKISFTPRVIPSQPAERTAVNLIRQFSGPQIATYIAQRTEEISDPAEVLLAALAQCRGMSNPDFQQFNQDVTQQVSDLVAGTAPKPNRAVATRISNLLKMAHKLSDDDFDMQRPDLEDQAREIAKVDSSTVLRHWLVWEIAQLLSNPQLPSALSERSSWAIETGSNSEGEK